MTDAAKAEALRIFGEQMGERVLNAAMLFGETAMDDVLEAVAELQRDNKRLLALVKNERDCCIENIRDSDACDGCKRSIEGDVVGSGSARDARRE